MKLSKYIEMLQTYLEINPETDIEVIMSQSGYYSEGEFADLFDIPEVYTSNDKTKFLCLGHSHQSY